MQITSEVLMHEIGNSHFVVANYLIDQVESGPQKYIFISQLGHIILKVLFRFFQLNI